MSDTRSELDLVFEGEGVSPSSTDARQLLSSVAAYLDAFAAVVGLAGEDVQSGLKLTFESVTPGSAHFHCAAQLEARIAKIVTFPLESVSGQLHNYLRHPTKAPKPVRAKVRRVIDTAKRLDSQVVFVAKVGASVFSITDAARRPAKQLVCTEEVIRAKVIRVGGYDPRVLLESESESRAFSLHAEPAALKQALNNLYGEVEAEVSLIRSGEPPFEIVDGELDRLTEIDTEVDPVEAWDRWYRDAGRPWAGLIDVEEALGRHE